MNILYTPEAVDDLNRLRSFISEKNPYAAQRVAGELLEGINKLNIFPKMGIQVSRAPDPSIIRDLFIGSYTVRYLLAGEEIHILRLWHGKEIEKSL
ncbi:type II toxin-antitoxin system RelE/ParE family toxin [Motiliproteus sp. MSK22-1]|uniref:type II toxin-antitoxin system RelE/ParE family toxin n=1 Tax=Motiliproteus sp. MSK22-1 TaxID=1897630 RepID=UPI00097884EE|nr:type II toxin-antitoxin system RelE/ParE family toxin [Motiliproteus sp. MSK22-1]OMH36590.1 plasmid stabilization protein [Motiliproteus sp. MSK22-1]